MKAVVISDSHGTWRELSIPQCDLLLSAGDNLFPLPYHKWLNRQPARHVVSILGNNEDCSEKRFVQLKKSIAAEAPRIHFIAEGAVEIEGVKIYGISGTKGTFRWLRNWGDPAINRWRRIPDDTEILITHVPPFGILDTPPKSNKQNHGYAPLLARVSELSSLTHHIFGHVHASAGECKVNGVHFINAAICDEFQKPVNYPRVFEFPSRQPKQAYGASLAFSTPTQG